MLTIEDDFMIEINWRMSVLLRRSLVHLVDGSKPSLLNSRNDHRRLKLLCELDFRLLRSQDAKATNDSGWHKIMHSESIIGTILSFFVSLFDRAPMPRS